MVTDKFCSKCGTERRDEGVYCTICGNKFNDDFKQEKNEAITTAESESTGENNQDNTIQNNTMSREKVLGIWNVVLNILFSCFLVYAYHLLKEYLVRGGDNPLGAFIILSIATYIALIKVYTIRGSHIIWVPTIVSIFLIYPSHTLYTDFYRWLGHQSTSFQSAFGSSATYALLFMIGTILIPIINLILVYDSYVVKKEIKAREVYK
jgi:hypothetical protein